MFHNICHKKCSFVETFSFDKRKEAFRRVDQCTNREKRIVEFCKDSVTIGVPHMCRGMGNVFKQSLVRLKTVAFKLRTLELRCVPDMYLETLGSLNCFKNIDTVVFTSSQFRCTPFNVFMKCPELRPKTLIFQGFSIGSLRKHDDDNKEIIPDSKVLPDSINNIKLYNSQVSIPFLYSITKDYKGGYFEKLIVDNSFIVALCSVEMRPKALEFIKLFKNVEVYYKDNFMEDIKGSINALLSEGYFFLPSVNISFNFILTCTYEDRHLMDDFDIPNIEKYLNIKSLKITRDLRGKHCEYIDLLSLCEELYLMENLTTLEIDFDLILSFHEFCISLRNNLKNVKINKCSGLKLYDIKKLSETHENIENLKLVGVYYYESITYKSILTLFRNLKGLSIQYDFMAFPKGLIYELKKKNENNLTFLLEWPKLNILNILFYDFKSKEKRILNEMERNTARKPGHFLIRSMPGGLLSRLTQIIIQKHTSYYDVFESFFNGM
uniref:F-box domain-containing protein n=1 Tax=Parastrongyloides trichosuri TaxID=131310 RepID=A0A0N4ZUN6_PARTI